MISAALTSRQAKLLILQSKLLSENRSPQNNKDTSMTEISEIKLNTEYRHKFDNQSSFNQFTKSVNFKEPCVTVRNEPTSVTANKPLESNPKFDMTCKTKTNLHLSEKRPRTAMKKKRINISNSKTGDCNVLINLFYDKSYKAKKYEFSDKKEKYDSPSCKCKTPVMKELNEDLKNFNIIQKKPKISKSNIKSMTFSKPPLSFVKPKESLPVDDGKVEVVKMISLSELK